ncbi:Flp pilus assembly complex ATPase component TadA, partial [bacterium]|nr:Flp pilus assembly complex ATPase component TadA [bacterium]
MKGETSKKLGQILLDDHLILPEQLDAALQKQTQTGKRLGQVLIDMDLITYDSLVSVLSRQNGIPHIWLRKGLIDPKIVHLVPREKAEAYQVIPMFKVHNTLTLAMADSTDLFVVDDIERLTGLKVQPVQCRSQDLVQTAIKEYYSEDVEMDDFLESFQESDVEVVETGHEDLRMVEEMAEGARIINLVNLILSNGIKEGASDIHIEPDIATSHVRYRIDGALQEVMTPRRNLHPAIVSRVKVMARMDISERRIPQDGRIHINADGREADVRVSS